MMVAITAAGAAACVLAMAAVVSIPAGRPAALYASMDKRDGSDALVNAILVARGSRCRPQSWPRAHSAPPYPSRRGVPPWEPAVTGWEDASAASFAARGVLGSSWRRELRTRLSWG